MTPGGLAIGVTLHLGRKAIRRVCIHDTGAGKFERLPRLRSV